MRRLRNLVPVLLLSASCLTITGCSKKAPVIEYPSRTSPQSLVGEAIPEILVDVLDGDSLTLPIVANTPTVLSLWATWCDPCQEEVPALLKWAEGRSDLRLIVLNVDDEDMSRDKLRRVAAELGLNAPIYSASPSRASAFGLRALPVLYLVDRDGVVREVREGFADSEAMTRWLDETLLKF